MATILALLTELLPVWGVLLVVGFGYLLLLVKRASDRFLDIADKQAGYLKDRVDVVDKSTAIFARTIDQQEKEIIQLTEQVAKLGRGVQNARETEARLSVEELKVLSSYVEQLSISQQELFRHIAKSHSPTESGEQTLRRPPELPKEILEQIPKAIRARDLSIYSILLTPISTADPLLHELRDAGYAASLYVESVNVDPAPEQHAGVWVGSAVPPAVAVEIISIARGHWPFLKYVHMSADGSGPTEFHTHMYLGGATQSAIGFMKCGEWSERDFDGLATDMTEEQLHDYVRARYRS